MGKGGVIRIVSVIGGWLWTKRGSGSGQNSGTLAVVRSSKEMKRVKRRVLAVSIDLMENHVIALGHAATVDVGRFEVKKLEDWWESGDDG